MITISQKVFHEPAAADEKEISQSPSIYQHLYLEGEPSNFRLIPRLYAALEGHYNQQNLRSNKHIRITLMVFNE